MTEKNYNGAALTTPDEIEGTCTHNGEEIDLVVEDLRKEDIDTLQEIQQVVMQVTQGEADADTEVPDFSFETEADEGEDYINVLIRHKLIKPDLNPDELTVGGLRSLMDGMAECWGVDEAVEQARGQMPTTGNR